MSMRGVAIAICLAVLCAANLAHAQEGLTSTEGSAVIGSEQAEELAQYTRIGVAPFRNDSALREAGPKFTEMLAGRLGARFPEAEFIVLDLTELYLPDGPLLLDEAIEVGNHFGIDALIDGTFSGVEIVGGTWPNRGSDFPQARGFLRWRLVECQTGLLRLDGVIAPEKPKTYPQRVRNSEQLIRRVMQDLVFAVGDELEAQALVAGTKLPDTQDGGDS